MYQPGPGGPGEQHPQHHGFYPTPNSHLSSVPGPNQKLQPAPKSGHLPPPHMFVPPGPPPPGPPPPGPQPPGPQPPGPMPFVAPGPPHTTTYIPPQQPYGQPYNSTATAYPPLPHQPPQHAMHFMPNQPDPAAFPANVAGAYPGFGMPLNPLNIMAAGGNLLSGGGGHWGQQYVERMQQRVGYFTGGALHFHFAINNQYVSQKLLMLLAPYLKRWTYTRTPEQMQGGPAFKPPCEDVNCPDLYLPLMALWSYVLLVCGLRAAGGAFKPDSVYPLVWSAVVAWLLHLLFARALLRAMALPSSIPWLELAAYTGYPLVPVCVSLVAGGLGGRGAYWAAWAYGSLCSAVFLVRTMKRVVFQETRGYGRDLTLVNYLLLALALFQFPYAMYLGLGVHP